MPSELDKLVAGLYRRGHPRPEHRAELEHELSGRFAALAPTRRPRRLRRWALASGAGVALAVGACMAPSEYGVEMGNRVGILVDVSQFPQVDVEALVSFVEHGYPLDSLGVEVRQERSVYRGAQGPTQEDTVMRIQLDMVGDGIDATEIWDDLVEEFPVLRGARMEDLPVQGRVRGTLGGRLAYDYLDWVIDRHGAEAARQRILQDLKVGGGAAGAVDARVEVDEDDSGRRRVKIKLRGTAIEDADEWVSDPGG